MLSRGRTSTAPRAPPTNSGPKPTKRRKPVQESDEDGDEDDILGNVLGQRKTRSTVSSLARDASLGIRFLPGFNDGGGNGPELKEPKDMGVPVSFKGKVNELMRTGERCWGCEHNFGPSRRPGQHRELDALYAEYIINRARMDPEQLYLHIYTTWERDIYDKEVSAGHNSLYWPLEMVATHIRNHMIDLVQSFESSFKLYDIMDQVLQEGVLRKMKNNTISACESHLKSLERVFKIKAAHVTLLNDLKEKS